MSSGTNFAPKTSNPKRESLGKLLRFGAEWLDLPTKLHDEAVDVYTEIAEWLHDYPSPLADYKPDLYPQGSFRLGTVVRPLTREDDYDIDLVCVLDIDPESITKAELKELVGDRLKKHPRYGGLVEPGRRCWTLNIDKKFHMDILPAVPDPDKADGHLLITDHDLHHWQHSSPKPYSTWFYGRMRTVLMESYRASGKVVQANVDEVPDWDRKTPLQRSIQILKRHRDMYFCNDEEDCPASIIVTTLAAHAYSNQPELEDALAAIIEGMPEHIEQDAAGNCIIENPVNDDENFADRWRGEPTRLARFHDWVKQAQRDLRNFEGGVGIDDIGNRMKPVLGERFTKSAATAYGDDLLKLRKESQLRVSAGTATLGAAGYIEAKPHTNFGE